MGRLMLDIAETSLISEDKEILGNKHVGGVVLFSRNFISKEQLFDLCQNIKAINRNIIIAVDQEGGRVQRFKEGFSRIPTMQSLGNFFLTSPERAINCSKDIGWLMASEMIASGIDISFAPVLDIDRATSSIIGDRAFSDNANSVIKLAGSFIEGMNEAGMQATGKHFPGHGAIHEDSHVSEPVDGRPLDDLINHDLMPFMELKDPLAAVMTAHITFPKIDSLPVSFSSVWLQKILRDQLHYKGVIFSDDLSMKGAGNATYAQKVQSSLRAGCDMVLVCNDRKGAFEAISYMEKNSISQSFKLKTMLKSKNSLWVELENAPRRASTVAFIEEFLG